MAVRGEASGLADRVGKVEEDIRNLRRLPGAVVPPPQATDVLPGGGATEEMYYLALQQMAGAGGVGGTDTYVNWTALNIVRTAGVVPPTPAPADPTRLVFHADGLHLVTLIVGGTDVVTPFTFGETSSSWLTVYAGNPKESAVAVAVPSLGTSHVYGSTSVVLHVVAGDQLEVLVRCVDFAVPHDVYTTVVLSRVGRCLRVPV